MLLERYFSTAGDRTELVLPKNLDLQEKLQKGPPKDIDFFPEEDERWQFAYCIEVKTDTLRYSLSRFMLKTQAETSHDFFNSKHLVSEQIDSLFWNL